MEITVDTIAQGHERVVRDILLYGEELETEDGELTIEWPPHDPYTIHIKHPFQHPMISDSCMFGEKSMQQYVNQLLTLHPPSSMSATYYYSNRLFDYPKVTIIAENDIEMGRIVEGNGNGKGINQIITSIVERLAKSPNSRRAIAITWVPEIDIQSREPPCLQIVQCFIRNNQLHMTVVFRSHDMLSAYGANVYGLAHMQKLICDEINELSINKITIGTLTTISSSSHIYWKRDKQELNEFKKRMIL